jgi:hypothetical protein
MTLHMRRVDDRTVVQDGRQPLDLPGEGWKIADGNSDDIRVCGAHPWQSSSLVFANGVACGTAMCNNPDYTIGDPRNFCSSVEKITNIHKIPTWLILKSGRIVKSDGSLVQDEKGARTSRSDRDVLLRRRV